MYFIFSKQRHTTSESPICSRSSLGGVHSWRIPQGKNYLLLQCAPLPGKLCLTSEFPSIPRRTREGPPGVSLWEPALPLLSHIVTLSEFSREELEAQEGKGLAVTCLNREGVFYPRQREVLGSRGEFQALASNCKIACSRPP